MEGHENGTERGRGVGDEPVAARAGMPVSEVLDEISLEDVLALGSEGSEPVDWASLVEDRSGQCPDCGLPDGPRHLRSCIAHPRPPSLWWIAFACFVLPLPLVLVVGPGALAFFLPMFALTWYIVSR